MISGRYYKAKNKNMCWLFDPTKPTDYIINLEEDKLYGKALSYAMPQSGFIWLREEPWRRSNWLERREEQYTGYFADCESEYPPELQDSHRLSPGTGERRSDAQCVE